MTELKFHNQKILLIGGSSGIGLAAAKAFVKNGADVIIGSKSLQKLEQALTQIGTNCSSCIIDIEDEDNVEKVMQDIGEINHIVFSAAMSPMPVGPIKSTSMKIAMQAMNTKFWGAYRIARSAKIVSGGSITFVSGILAQRPTKSSTLLTSINSSVDGLARGLALELDNIRVNSVSPGLLDSAAIFKQMDINQRAEIIKSLPAKKIGTPELIADAILFLAGNSYVTGTNLIIDGGKSLV